MCDDIKRNRRVEDCEAEIKCLKEQVKTLIDALKLIPEQIEASQQLFVMTNQRLENCERRLRLRDI